MKLHKGQKKMLFGYALLVNRSGKAKDWERVEPSFSSRWAAVEFYKHRHSGAKAWKIEGIRFDVRAIANE